MPGRVQETEPFDREQVTTLEFERLWSAAIVRRF